MTSPLRITHLITNAEFAGTERYVVDVSAQLAARGHDVEVIGGRPDPVAQLVTAPVRWRPGADVGEAVRSLRAGGRRDIVHSHMARSDFVALATAPLTRAARVSTRHITARRGYHPLVYRAGRLVRRSLACELAVSSWTSDQLDQPADIVLCNGVHEVPDVEGERARRVLVAQRLVSEKDTATALRAWHASGLGDRGWQLTIAGSGDEDALLRRLAAELDCADSVDFAGWVGDVAAFYRTSAVLLAPAPTEPCGLTVLEAMAHGLAVVAAGSGGHLETVGTLPGAALFPPGDHDAAAAHLVRLADDEAARETYGHELRALQRAAFTVAGHAAGLEAIYLGAVRSRRD